MATIYASTGHVQGELEVRVGVGAGIDAHGRNRRGDEGVAIDVGHWTLMLDPDEIAELLGVLEELADAE